MKANETIYEAVERVLEDDDDRCDECGRITCICDDDPREGHTVEEWEGEA